MLRTMCQTDSKSMSCPGLRLSEFGGVLSDVLGSFTLWRHVGANLSDEQNRKYMRNIMTFA